MLLVGIVIDGRGVDPVLVIDPLAATETMQADHDFPRAERTLDCAVCDHERIVAEPDESATCPNCRTTYSLVIREGFALVEADGWATRLTLDVPDEFVSASLK